jgi:toxin ParE1/3/4
MPGDVTCCGSTSQPYIAQDDPDAAERWVIDLFDTVERLADFPESGRIVPEVDVRRIREVIFGAYRVIYSVKDKAEILTVRREPAASIKRYR